MTGKGIRDGNRGAGTFTGQGKFVYKGGERGLHGEGKERKGEGEERKGRYDKREERGREKEKGTKGREEGKLKEERKKLKGEEGSWILKEGEEGGEEDNLC